MARTTLNDLARKARIREREYRQMNMKLRKLDNITPEQVATLQKIKAAEVKNKPLKASAVENWLDLRAMGAVRENEGNLVLSSLGAQVVSSEGK